MANSTQIPSGKPYDAAGDVTYDGPNYYAYDAEGRVCATQSAPYSGGIAAYGYLYDAEGRRVAKGSITPAPLGQWPSCNPATNGFTLTESYVLGQGGERLTTTSWAYPPTLVPLAAGATPVPVRTLIGTWQSTNVYAAGKLIATYDAATSGAAADAGSAGGLHFQLTDPLGTRRVQTNSAGEAELDCQSLPFGDQLNYFPDPNAPGNDQDEDATGSLTGIHFTGKERDQESGLDYFGARYYGPSMGRFMSPDWSDVPMAVPYGDLENPQSLDLYAYVNNNPLSNVDDDGHAKDCGGGGDPSLVCLVTRFWDWLTSGGKSNNSNGDTGAHPQNPDPNFTPQLHTRPTPSPNPGGGTSNQAFANYMDSHYPNTKGGGHCARACRLGMEAGGMNTNGRPGDAKNYGPFLLQHGYHTVPGASYFGNEQVGDIAVFQPAPGHSQSGHIEMWDGQHWMSDFRQQHFSPYRGLDAANLDFKIYRQN